MNRLRERISSAAADERGFTLIELLVVMLILANLAAITLPAFFNQRSKAQDAKAKEMAHTAQVAMETCATNNGGVYTACELTALRAIEPTIPATGVTVPSNTGGGYTVTSAASNGNTYSIIRSPTGVITFPCTVATTNRGGCPGSGIAPGLWG